MSAVIIVRCAHITGAITHTARAARWLDSARDCVVWRRIPGRFAGAPG